MTVGRSGEKERQDKEERGREMTVKRPEKKERENKERKGKGTALKGREVTVERPVRSEVKTIKEGTG